MGIRKKIVVLALVGIGGGTAVYAPIALGLSAGLSGIGGFSDDESPDAKREKILNKLARYEDKLLRGEDGVEPPHFDSDTAEVEALERETANREVSSGSKHRSDSVDIEPLRGDSSVSESSNDGAYLKRAALADSSDPILIAGDQPADSELASGGTERQDLSPPSAASLGVSGDEPFRVEAVTSQKQIGEEPDTASVRNSSQDRLIAELIKYRYKIKALEQELQTVRNSQALAKEDETLRSKPEELQREDNQRIEDLNREVSRLKREAGYSEQLKTDLSAALGRIDELKSQLESRGGEMVIARRSSAADEQEKLALARQNKELRSAINDKEQEIKDLQARTTDNSNDRNWLRKLQAELESAKKQIAELQDKNRELTYDKEEFDQNRQVLEKRNQDVSKLSNELARVGSQGKQIDQLKTERDKLAARITELEQNSRSKAKLESDLEAVIKRSDTVAREKKELETKLTELSDRSSKTASENAELKRKLDELTAQISGNEQKLEQAAREAKLCGESLDKKSQVTAKVPELVKKLVETKNELMLREAELQTLGTNDKGTTSAGKTEQLAKNDILLQSGIDQPTPTRVAPPVSNRMAPTPTPIASDVMIVQVASDKANARSGPGEEYATLMQVSRGMQLSVETQEGEWYRVILPTGNRAYIRADVVAGGSRIKAPVVASAPAKSASAARTKSRPNVVGDTSLMIPFDSAPAQAGSSVDEEAKRAFDQLKDELMSKSRPR